MFSCPLPILVLFSNNCEDMFEKKLYNTFFGEDLSTLVLQQVYIVASFAINTKATSVVYTINVFISKFGL